MEAERDGRGAALMDGPHYWLAASCAERVYNQYIRSDKPAPEIYAGILYAVLEAIREAKRPDLTPSEN